METVPLRRVATTWALEALTRLTSSERSSVRPYYRSPSRTPNTPITDLQCRAAPQPPVSSTRSPARLVYLPTSSRTLDDRTNELIPSWVNTDGSTPAVSIVYAPNDPPEFALVGDKTMFDDPFGTLYSAVSG